MKRLTYQQNERRLKARLISSLLSTWESLETGAYRGLNGYLESDTLAGVGLFNLSLGKLTPEGQRIVDEVLAVEIKKESRHER